MKIVNRPKSADPRIFTNSGLPVTSPKILILGGFGYVGTKLLELLRGYDVTVVDNLLSGAKPLSDVKFIYGDIRDFDLMYVLIPRYDIIIHLAAIVGEPACLINPGVARDINVNGLQNVINVLQRYQKFIFISSSSVYGNVPGNTTVTEETVLQPNNHYALHKTFGETLTTNSGIPYIILRPATAFGVSQRIRLDLLVNTFIYEALTTGKIDVFEPELIRPMIHVNDFARVIKSAVMDELGWNEIYNIGDPSLTVTKYMLAQKIGDPLGARVQIINGSSIDLRNYNISFDKIISRGFIFSTDTIKHAVTEIQQHIDVLKENPKKFSTPEMFTRFLQRI